MSKNKSKIDREIDTAVQDLKRAVAKIRENVEEIERISKELIAKREKK